MADDGFNGPPVQNEVAICESEQPNHPVAFPKAVIAEPVYGTGTPTCSRNSRKRARKHKIGLEENQQDARDEPSEQEIVESEEEDFDSSEENMWLRNGIQGSDITEAAGNVDDILNILGVGDSPPPRKRERSERKNMTSDSEEETDSGRIVRIDGPEVEGENGFVWSTVPVHEENAKDNTLGFQPGPTDEAVHAIDPLECFKLFMTDDIIDEIISSTNVKLEEVSSRVSKAYDSNRQVVAADEFCALLSLLILGGALQNNKLRAEMLFDTMICGEQYRATMSSARFAILTNAMNFATADSLQVNDGEEKIAPVAKIWNMFLEKCQTHYIAGSHVTIGKQIITFRGQCPFKITLHSPVRHGMQFFLLVDNASKYLINALPYLGRDVAPEDSFFESYVVNKLVNPLKGSNRNVTMDEWFTSIELAEDLLNESKLTMIGQIKKTKKELPSFFVDHRYKHRKSGSSIFLYASNVTAVSYKLCNNTGLMTLISTSHNGQLLRGSSGKPDIVHDYEATRGAVEAFDNNCNKINTGRKTGKWTTAFFYNMLNMAVQNAYVVYMHNFTNKRANSKIQPLRKLDFMLTLVNQLSDAWMRVRLDLPLPANLRSIICRRLNVAELKTPAPEASRDEFVLDTSRKTCSVCHYKTRRKTRFLCCFCCRSICNEHCRRMCLHCWNKAKFHQEQIILESSGKSTNDCVDSGIKRS